jgi:hypothetical protein
VYPEAAIKASFPQKCDNLGSKSLTRSALYSTSACAQNSEVMSRGALLDLSLIGSNSPLMRREAPLKHEAEAHHQTPGSLVEKDLR